MACKRLKRSRPSSTVKLPCEYSASSHKDIDHSMLAYDLDRDIENSVGVWVHGKGGAGGRVRANCILHL